MKQYWQNLNEREKLMLSLGIVFSTLYLIYLLIYAPISKALTNKTNELIDKRDTLAYMQQMLPLKDEANAKETLSQSELLSNLASQLSLSAIDSFTHQLQQTSNGDIQLSFDKVPFNEFIRWLQFMNQTYAIQVRQFSANKTEEAGVVKVMVVMGVD